LIYKICENIHSISTSTKTQVIDFMLSSIILKLLISMLSIRKFFLNSTTERAISLTKLIRIKSAVLKLFGFADYFLQKKFRGSHFFVCLKLDSFIMDVRVLNT
jgi:hypothetical protein